MAGGMLASVAAFAAMEVAIAVIGKVSEIANKARDRIKELAEETMGLRDEMRELANLKGDPGARQRDRRRDGQDGDGGRFMPKEVRISRTV